MRIVAGKFRSRIIKAPQGEITRPSSDKTREAIFNIIAPYVYDAKVLDIFSGSGALGLEALSRDAKNVTFIDNDLNAINTINDNINTLNVNDKCKVINDSYLILKEMKNEKFDIILLDPPYKLNVFDEILNIILENDLLNDNGLIVYESNNDFKLIDKYEGFKLKQKKYGIAFVNILIRN